MALYDSVRDLPLTIERYELEGHEYATPSFTRKTTVIRLVGACEEGLGEDVTYDAGEQEAQQARGPVLPLSGDWTIDSFSRHLESLPLFAESPEREVYVMVGDGSYLMMNSEIVTSIQEGYKLTIVLLDNSGYKSIGGLSRSLGQDGFATRYVFPQEGVLPGDSAGAEVQTLPVDLATNACSLGAHLIRCETREEFGRALEEVELRDAMVEVAREAVRGDRQALAPRAARGGGNAVDDGLTGGGNSA